MNARALALLLFAAAAARADQAWIFEPGQALVSIELGPVRARVSAVSLGVSGRVRELEGGGVRAEIRVALASFAASSPAAGLLKDEAAQFPEIVFAGAAPSGRDGVLHLEGTLTFHGVSRPLALPVKVVRAAGMTFGHAAFSLHLRDYGFALPPGVPDEARVEVDAGLRPEGAVVSRG